MQIREHFLILFSVLMPCQISFSCSSAPWGISSARPAGTSSRTRSATCGNEPTRSAATAWSASWTPSWSRAPTLSRAAPSIPPEGAPREGVRPRAVLLPGARLRLRRPDSRAASIWISGGPHSLTRRVLQWSRGRSASLGRLALDAALLPFTSTPCSCRGDGKQAGAELQSPRGLRTHHGAGHFNPRRRALPAARPSRTTRLLAPPYCANKPASRCELPRPRRAVPQSSHCSYSTDKQYFNIVTAPNACAE
jgi:hypothetical protein